FGNDFNAWVFDEVFVEFSAESVLYAVDGPSAAVCREVFGLRGMPVAALEDGFAAFEEFAYKTIQRRDDLVAVLDGERTAGAEVVLHVNDYECAPAVLFLHHPLSFRKAQRSDETEHNI